MPRKGWTKLAGTAERYLSPSGEVISRRQYDNLRAQAEGWDNRSQYENRYNDSTYLWAFQQYRREQKLSIQQARRSDRMGGAMNKKLRAAQATGWGKTREGRAARGPMARLLVEMGYRDPSATYAVGDTDGAKGKR